MNGLGKLLDRLDGCRQNTPETWVARCPAHEDKSPSLSIRETGDGRILLHCFAGCSVDSVCAAVGMEVTELFPDSRTTEGSRPLKRRFAPQDVLAVLYRELVFLSVCAADVARGETLTDTDRRRLEVASRRFNAAVEAAGL